MPLWLRQMDEPLKGFWWIRRQWVGHHAKACKFQWNGIKAQLVCAKPRCILCLGLKGYFLFDQSCRCHCCSISVTTMRKFLMWFVQMLFGCLSRGTGKGLAQPCPPSPSLYTVGQHLGTSGVIAALIPSSSWTGHLWMQNTEEIESWVIFTVLLLASAL